MICHAWKVMFHAEYSRDNPCACWSICERPSTTLGKTGDAAPLAKSAAAGKEQE